MGLDRLEPPPSLSSLSIQAAKTRLLPRDVGDLLRDQCPFGHPDFIPRLLHIVQLHSDKNHDYAHGGPPLGNFDRTAAIMQLYPQFPWATNYGCAVVQMLKQLDAFLWQTRQEGFQAKVEGADSRLRDIAVFSQLIAIMLQETPH